jgi:branched-chain amino acid transport system ATP-binding protein
MSFGKHEFLKIENLSMYFRGLKALNRVSFLLEKGLICGLIGPNGAGKTTLLNCLTRVYYPQAGRVFFNGHDVLARPIHRIAELGICRTFQNLELFKEATVHENLLIGCLFRFQSNLVADLFGFPATRRKFAKARKEVDSVIDQTGLNPYAHQKVSALPFGVQKTVELARALAGQPQLLLLDEPAAGMNPEESLQLAEMLRQLRGQQNITILLIEHDMRLIMNICDQIIVLDHGEKICEGPPSKVRTDPQVIKAYLGEEGSNA